MLFSSDNTGGSYRQLARRAAKADGALGWASVAVLGTPNDGSAFRACADAANGLIQGNITVSGPRVRGQRVTAAGTLSWSASGDVVIDEVSTTSDKRDLRLVCDHAGGAIYVWQDDRGPNFRIQLQGVSVSGAK